MQTKNHQGDHVIISSNGFSLKGILSVPEHNVGGIVIFAHGSGSGRYSPRNQFVANFLNQAHFCTLLFDLLTEEEEEFDSLTRKLRFDISLLTERLILATLWTLKESKTKNMSIGYFGASTGAAAALSASAKLDSQIKAIVSRGGRPDLTISDLRLVNTQTLLIVGSKDQEVIKYNQEALSKMREGIATLTVVAGATHLFEETGALEQVCHLSADWFQKYLCTNERFNICRKDHAI